jgi:adenine/guanine phosphoribosyltransferase-like PRPP-binding protein
VSPGFAFTNRKQISSEESVVGLLKRKEERTETVAVRVPSSLKAQLEELRKRADAAGFDLTATIAESMTRLAKQVSEELDASTTAQRKSKEVRPAGNVVGLTRAGGEYSPGSGSNGMGS